MDARNKLQQAIANKQGKPGAEPPSSGGSAGRSPAKPAPIPSQRPAASGAPSAAKAKARKSVKSKKKPPKAQKASRGGSGFLAQGFQKFAKTLVDEFKNATSEISPKALISTASEGLQGLKSMVTPGRSSEGDDAAETSPSASLQNGASGRGAPVASRSVGDDAPDAKTVHNPAQAPSLRSKSKAGAGQQAAAPGSQPQEAEQNPVEFSPAKVQRHSGGKRKLTEEDERARLESEIETAAETPAPSGDAAQPPQPAPQSQEAEQDPVEFSPAKVQRHSGGKRKLTEEDERAILESEIETASEPGEGAEARAAEPQSQENSEARPDGPAAETEAPAAQASEQEAGNDGKSQQKKLVRKQPKAQVRISKTEHAIRGFQALQTVLSNPIWTPIIIKSDAKPSSIYSPRKRFDEMFADPVFREGLKAASRLATTYAFAPEKMRFIAKTIETVRSFELDPGGNIKSYTELLTKTLPEETVKSAFLLFRDPHVQHLLFSVGTRLGMFLPTIEILTRIYVGLRKKANLIPGERLKIQHEVLIRYQKAPYTEDMAKKARSLALTYFSDYLAEYAMKLYEERFDKVPQGRDDVDSYYRRHEVIKTHGCNLLDEWSVRIGLSASMLANIKTRFVKGADLFIDEIFARVPSE